MRHERHRSENVPRPSRRTGGGFTLVELLVVIGIILLLMAVSTLVLGNVIQSARIRATEATILKINGMVQQRQEAFQRAVEKADLSKAVNLFKQNKQDIFPPEIDAWVVDSASERTWEVLARKLYFRLSFPQTFAEVCGFDTRPGLPNSDDDGNGVTDFYPRPVDFHHYQGTPDPKELGQGANNDDLAIYAALIRDRMTDPAKHRPETQSAALLYLILTGGEVFGVPAVGENEFSTSEVRDTDGDGLLEFVDGWGRPLRFYRWPTRLLRCGEDSFTGDTNGDGSTTPSGPNAVPDPRYANLLIGTLPSLNINDASLLRDPDDGLNLIYTQVIKRNTSTTPTSDRQFNARLKFEEMFHTPETYHTFLIVSAGPDGRLGLYEPVQFSRHSESNVFGHLAQPISLGDPSASPLADNITNRRR
uniref:Prepilin-type N-terminal cleavage/methylation domain-containing protein n=1 Tax=Schlesneria paludicola TaxID=360056 RepID=A0A7C4QN09_9PLAN